jgi:hypothetical protein
VVCTLISEGEWCKLVWAMWGSWRGSGWSRRTVGRVRETRRVPCSEGSLLQVINVYCMNRYMHVCLPSSSLQALVDKEERVRLQ